METIVSTKGQVVIPKALRERWGLTSGVRVRVRSTATGIELAPIAPRDEALVRKGRGLAKYKGPPLAVEDMDPLKALETRE